MVLTAWLAFAGLPGGAADAQGLGKNKAAPAVTSKPPAQPSPASVPVPEDLGTGYSIKPAEVAVPQDVPLGQYKRTIWPFPNWTLICDEDLAKKQKICNVAQTIVDQSGATVFSWSLAATQDGQPILILRTPRGVNETQPIGIDLADGAAPLTVPVRGCDTSVCLAYLPVGPRLKAAAAKGTTVRLTYSIANAGNPAAIVSLRAPFAGLSAALAAI